jgi:hypothetical protein
MVLSGERNQGIHGIEIVGFLLGIKPNLAAFSGSTWLNSRARVWA